MADPICRWRNTTIKQVVEFTNILPHSQMPKDEAHKYVESRWALWDGGNNFFKTPYQLASQLALYYEDDKMFYPRFDHVVSVEEAQDYLNKWIRLYYVPNPYTASFPTNSHPVVLNESLYNEATDGGIDLDTFFFSHFNVELGNKDILSNVLNQFSDVCIANGLVTRKEAVKHIDLTSAPVNGTDKRNFFIWFGNSGNPNRTADIIPIFDSQRQIIYYGAPGTGKSYKIKGLVRDGNHVRTTFHPDSDYASFVGAYKPTMIEISSRDMAGHVILDKGDEVKEKKIVYEFVAQAFLQAYTEAWKRSVGVMTDKEGKNVEMPEGMDDKYYLVIEEINRGNCAQIFGDLFQLLDRDDNGESSYAIRPDQDMKRYLAEQFKDIEALPETIRRGEEMKLPSNLYIFATMNTSDQSLFPIDSAFKRRWDWEYVPIKDEKKGYYIKVDDTAYLWSDFLEKINETILRVTQSDDKQMGYWFVHLPEGQKEISTDKFVGKVLFYLWNDVFKDFGDGEDTIFIGEKEDGSKYDLRFKSFFDDERNERIRDLMRYNKIEPTEIEDDAEEQIAEVLENSDGSTSIDKASNAYNKWKNKHDNYWVACQKAYENDPILKTGQRTDYPNAYDIPLEDINNVTMRIWHLTHKGEKCMAMGVWIPETTNADTLDALVEAIPEWNEKLNQKFVHLSLNTGSHIRTYSPQYDFNNPADVEASIEWVKNLAPLFYNTVKDTLKG